MFNPLRRAGCEGARESRGSHAASLNEGFGWVHVEDMHSLVLGFLVRAFSVTRWTLNGQTMILYGQTKCMRDRGVRKVRDRPTDPGHLGVRRVRGRPD